ncbi:MAG: DUF4199 domain-containing protein [Bacteroidetes bacterium]|nr:MAG: DUF4199 domain-containing protein [Bacteroidota bacterium]
MIRKLGLKYGIIAALISLVYNAILQVLGYASDQFLGSLGQIFLVLAMVLACKDFKTANSGFMNFSQGMGMGFWISLLTTIVGTVFLFIYLNYDPQTITQTLKIQEMALENQGKSDEEIKVMMDIVKEFMTPTYLAAAALISNMIFSMLLAVVVSLVMRKMNPDVFAD